jgi:succinoglycan biosynthesis transport protein ExoP
LLTRFREHFQTVLIDSPPLLMFPEARMLGRMADGVILVVRANQTRRGQAQAARNRLLEDWTPLVGTVLNDWEPANGNGYADAYAKYASFD